MENKEHLQIHTICGNSRLCCACSTSPSFLALAALTHPCCSTSALLCIIGINNLMPWILRRL